MGLKRCHYLVAVLGAIMAWVTAPAPAYAACIELDLAIHYAGGSDYYPFGPDKCVVDTPWNQTDEVYFDEWFVVIPQGLPNGLYVEVRYTSP
jgi:hypothetical protein